MEIIWHGHSCFTLEYETGSVVFDPYSDGSVPGLAPLFLHANMVLNSHKHADHNGHEVVRTIGVKPFYFWRLPTYHDNVQGRLRGPNDIYMLEAEDMRFVHLGDLGCELNEDQIALMKDCDVLMIPVGGYYTIDAAMAHKIVDQLMPRIVIPMHYRSETFGYPVLDTVDVYLQDCQDVVFYDTNTLIVTKDTPSQTAVLTYLGY